MADTIPFVPSDNNYSLQVAIDSTNYLFDVRWNSRDVAWYFDFYDASENLIAAGVKVVLGAPLCRTSQHVFFKTNILTPIDTSGQDLEAGFDDLGARVIVLRQTVG